MIEILMCGYVLIVILTGAYYVKARLKEEGRRIDEMIEEVRER